MSEQSTPVGEDGGGTKKREGGRKKDFKKKDKDKGYRMFEQEDSEEERLVTAEDTKSPISKMKKHSKPSFKFAKREKLYKVKEKSEKHEKEEKKDEGKKDKEEKGEKKKEKLKFRKKKKHKPEAEVEIKPIFGVPISVAVDRNKCHDGIPLPALVRECVDYIEEFGLQCEGIYRISGVKSKVQALKDAYNRGQLVYLPEYEPNVIASLLKLFLRELPEPVLTMEYLPKFEQASTIKNVKQKVEGFQLLIQELPAPNRLLLSWMIVHMTHIIAREKQNKMSLQNVSIVLSPTMQISHRVLNVLFTYSKILFRDVIINKYVPPLKPVTSRWSLELPESPSAIEEELRKQESLLTQLHQEIAHKHNEEKEEQLWEVQRVCTQLKRKLKLARKAYETHKEAEKRDQEVKENHGTHVRKSSKEKSPGIPTSKDKKLQGSPPKQSVPVLKKKVTEGRATTDKSEEKEDKKSLQPTTPQTPKIGGIVGVPDLGASASPTQHRPTLEQQLIEKERIQAAEKLRAASAAKKAAAASSEVKDKESIDEKKATETEDITEDAKDNQVSKEDQELVADNDTNIERIEDVDKKPDISDDIPIEDTKTKEEEKDAKNDEVSVDKTKEVNESNREEVKVDAVKKDQIKTDEVKVDEVKVDEVKVDEEKVDEVKVDEVKVDKVKVDEVKVDEVKVDKVKDAEVEIDEVKTEPVEQTSSDEQQEVHNVQYEEDLASVEMEQALEGGELPLESIHTPPSQLSSEEECVTPTRSTPEPSHHGDTSSTATTDAIIAEEAPPSQPIKSPIAGHVHPPKMIKLQSPLQPQKVYSKATGESESDSDAETPIGDSEVLPSEGRLDKHHRTPSSEDGITMEAHQSDEFDASREVWEAFGEARAETPEDTSFYGDDEITDQEYDQLQQEHQVLMLEEEELISLRDELRKKIEAEKTEIERLHQECADLQAIREDLYDSDTASSDSSDESDDEEELQDVLRKLMVENEKLQADNNDLCQKIHEERQICLDVKVEIRVIQQRRNEPPPDISLIEL